jgi:hypothetical protein
MKILTLLFLFLIQTAFGAEKASLAPSDYGLAEVVFRQYVSVDEKKVYHLFYRTNHSVLPAEFMARFKGNSPVVRSMPDGVTAIRKGILLDKKTRKEAICVGIGQPQVVGDKAEVQVFYFSSGTGIRTRYFLDREQGKWTVKGKKMEIIACRG